MSKHDKPQVKFELQLSAADDGGYLELKLVNNTDKKYRIVDVMHGAKWTYAGTDYYAEEKFLLLAPVIPGAEISIAQLAAEDLLTTTYIFIDAYTNLRDAEPERYVGVIRGLHRLADRGLAISKLSIPLDERKDAFRVHDRAKSRPDGKPEIRRMLSKRLDKAMAIAATAHTDQLRKGSETPYIVHPFRVMHIANQVTNDEDILIACLLHDILEDVPERYSRDQMLEDFGARVVGFVDDVTKNTKIKSWRTRSEAYLAHLETAEEQSVIVCAADKINNLNATLLDYEQHGDKLWKRFNANKSQLLWWYEEVYRIVRRRLPESPLREAMGRQMKQFRKIVRA
jgi:hypothetical protein